MHKKIISLILIFAMFLISVAPAFAKDASETPEGIFRCDWFNESIYYPYEYSDDSFLNPSSQYTQSLALFSLCVSMASFESFDNDNPDENIRKVYDECGYSTVSYGYETEGYDTVGLAVGYKDTVIGGKPYTVVLAIVRSGNYYMEWGGNLRLGKGVNHLGFDIGKATALDYLNEFFKANPPENEVKILLSGYSRGASIANLMAAELLDGRYTGSIKSEDAVAKAEINPENIYTYTFEAPQTTRDVNAHSEVYDRIYNLVNTGDYVPMFPMENWGFTHYGTRLELPSADNCDNYDSYYERIIEEFDSYMQDSGRKAKDCFYNAEDSRSAQATLQYIYRVLGDDVMRSQDYYADNYESVMVFMTGQYLGKKRNFSDMCKTVGVAILAAALSMTPNNSKKIESEGFKNYLADYIADSSAATYLTADEMESLMSLIIELLKLVANNRKEVISLVGQLKTMVHVHQPYTAMVWMRILTEEDILSINAESKNPVDINFDRIDIKSGNNAQLVARHRTGTVKWSSDNEKIASVDSSGIVTGHGKGTAVITATLVDDSGKEVASDNVEVEVYRSAVQTVLAFFRRITEKI